MATVPVMPVAANHNILEDIASYLQYEISEGRNRTTVPAEIADFIRSKPVHSATPPARVTGQPHAGTAPIDVAPSFDFEKPAPGSAAASVPTESAGTSGGIKVPSESSAALQKIAAEISACTLCHLCKTRTKTVPGQGNPVPEIMFIGEGPGMDEDQAGLAFVGAAGQLLTRMIEAMGLTREQVFIGNVVKCHPPGENTPNRAPTPDEIEVCVPYLKRQIDVLQPKVIVALGGVAVKTLTGAGAGITKLRGTWLQFRGIDLRPTFHPSYLLRTGGGKPDKKLYWDVWQDLLAVLARLGKEPPSRGKEK